MNHVNFTHIPNILSALSEKLAAACELSSSEEHRTISVAGVLRPISKVNVIDLRFTLAAKDLYQGLINDTSYHDCRDCRFTFLQLLKTHECELSLRIMNIFRNQGKLGSCEHVGFNNVTKNIEVVLRRSASLATQSVVPIPPVYFGPFESLCEVQQRQFAVSCAESNKPVLATWHLADCIAVVGFDKVHRVGFLFHIDEQADVLGGFKQLVADLKGHNRHYSFEYQVTGGADSRAIRTGEIQQHFQSVADPIVNFIKRESQDAAAFSSHAFTIDSYWSRAVRLSRSVAIDLRLDDPLAQCLGYEPELNPSSALHTRAQTIEEADTFCLATSSEVVKK